MNTPYVVDDICGDTLTVWPESECGEWKGYDRFSGATSREVALALRLRETELDYQATIARLKGDTP